MKCLAFDHIVVDDLGGLPSKSLLWDRVQKCATIFSDVFDFCDFLMRVAEIEAVVAKCTLILYFPLLNFSYRRSAFYQQLHQT